MTRISSRLLIVQWSRFLASLYRVMFGLVWLTASVAPGFADNAPSPSANESDVGRVLLKMAGAEILTATVVPEFARDHLASYGAAGIKIENAEAPWSFRVIGHTASGEAVSILVRTSTSQDALQRLIKGEIDIALTTRHANTEEIAAFPTLAETGVAAAGTPLAHAALVIAVNPANSVSNLTFAQLQGIFAGSITDWAEVGGKPGPIHPYVLPAETGASDLFRSIVIGPDAASRRPGREVTTSAEMRRDLLNDPGGIGYTAVPAGLKLLNIDVEPGHRISPPDFYQLTSEDYPLTQTLYMYRDPNSTNPSVNLFLRMALSVPAQFTIVSAGLSYMGPQLILPALPDDTPAPYGDLTNRGLRVNLTVRFGDESTAIDSSANYDLDLLARYLRILGMRADHIVLAAFSDDTGDPGRDRATSEEFGKIVAAELMKRHVPTSDILALGSSVQLANNVTPAGRGINRRVEIWLRP